MPFFSGTRGFAIGFLTGFGAGFIARDAYPQLRSVASPVIKALMRAGIRGAEQSRESLARFGEILQDHWAEVQMEMKNERMAPLQPKPRAKKPAKRQPVQERGQAQGNVVRLHPKEAPKEA